MEGSDSMKDSLRTAWCNCFRAQWWLTRHAAVGFVLGLSGHVLTFILNTKRLLSFSDILLFILLFIMITVGMAIYIFNRKRSEANEADTKKAGYIKGQKKIKLLFIMLVVYTFFHLLLITNFDSEAPYNLMNKLTIHHQATLPKNLSGKGKEIYQLFEVRCLTAFSICYFIAAIGLLHNKNFLNVTWLFQFKT